MSNRFSFDGAGASQTASAGGSTVTGAAVRVVSTAGAAAASQDARQERAAALGADAGGGGGAGGKYVPAHLRNGGGRASAGAGAGAGSRGGFGGGRGGGFAGGRGGYGGAQQGGYGGAQQGGYGGGSRPNSRGGGDFGSFGGRNAGGFGGFGGQQQARPQGGRFDMGGAGALAPAPAPRWPGLDGLDDFEDKLAEDQAAFFQKFGEPRSSGIDFAKYDKIDVEVKDSVPGKPALPAPQKTFEALKLGKVLSRNLSFNKYEIPTPVQQHAIPIAVCGRDIMACAQTGSGKTLAFMLPICWHLLKRGAPPVPQDRRVPISALGLAPTRELAVQIHEESQKFAFRSGLRFAIAYGGTHVNEQIRAIERGCDVLIATPGRLVDMLERGTVTLRHVIFLVLDEADRMLDMGFEPAMRQIIQGMDMPTGAEGRRTMMFSATFPVAIQRLAADFLFEPVHVTVGKVGAASANVTQIVMNVEDHMKPKVLCDQLTSNPGRTLIFVETKRNADMLEFALQDRKFPATSIHGDRSQQERESALEGFKNGKTPILVATNVAARGLDISDVTHVINFDMPKDIDDYIHRIGRTGRAGNRGTATSFVNDYNLRICKELVLVLNEAGQEVPKWLKSMAARGPAVQGLGFSKRSDRDVDGFDSTGAEAEPETIAVHTAFGAPPPDAGGGMFDSDDGEDSVW